MMKKLIENVLALDNDRKKVSGESG